MQTPESKYSEDVRQHLTFIQGVITRLNSNSFSMKGWMLAIVSAICAIYAANTANCTEKVVWVGKLGVRGQTGESERVGQTGTGQAGGASFAVWRLLDGHLHSQCSQLHHESVGVSVHLTCGIHKLLGDGDGVGAPVDAVIHILHSGISFQFAAAVSVMNSSL